MLESDEMLLQVRAQCDRDLTAARKRERDALKLAQALKDERDAARAERDAALAGANDRRAALQYSFNLMQTVLFYDFNLAERLVAAVTAPGGDRPQWVAAVVAAWYASHGTLRLAILVWLASYVIMKMGEAELPCSVCRRTCTGLMR